jgi:hypothetical protein
MRGEKGRLFPFYAISFSATTFFKTKVSHKSRNTSILIHTCSSLLFKVDEIVTINFSYSLHND